MALYDRTAVEKDTVQARQMFMRDILSMFAYVLFFYGILGAAFPWRMGASTTVIWNAVKGSLFFGVCSGVVLLAVGTPVMSRYLLAKARYVDFSPAASLAMVWSFRLTGVIGVLFALWDIFHIILPAAGSLSANFLKDWWMLVLLAGGVAGWFAGRSVGGLIALLAIWSSGRKILSQL